MRKIKALIIIGMLVMSSVMMCACSKGFECDLCGVNSRGKSYNLSTLGYGYVCEECYNMLCGRGR